METRVALESPPVRLTTLLFGFRWKSRSESVREPCETDRREIGQKRAEKGQEQGRAIPVTQYKELSDDGGSGQVRSGQVRSGAVRLG